MLWRVDTLHDVFYLRDCFCLFISSTFQSALFEEDAGASITGIGDSEWAVLLLVKFESLLKVCQCCVVLFLAAACQPTCQECIGLSEGIIGLTEAGQCGFAVFERLVPFFLSHVNLGDAKGSGPIAIDTFNYLEGAASR